jgi:hypothetical protein
MVVTVVLAVTVTVAVALVMVALVALVPSQLEPRAPKETGMGALGDLGVPILAMSARGYGHSELPAPKKSRRATKWRDLTQQRRPE